MTRALFVTVASHELYVPVNAWLNNMGPCAHVTYNAFGPPNDEAILACAKGYKPEVIFYIGSNTGVLPKTKTLKALRNVAPCIHYQSDVEDEAWFDLLREYRREGCFDLIVGQTGVKTDLIDMATLMAIDIDAFAGPVPKDLSCTFSGSLAVSYKPGVDEWDGRAEIVHGLGENVAIRHREPVGDYREYVASLKRSRFTVNVSLTGSGKRHHVKWRVLEAAFANCALLEMADSPTALWFPEDTYFKYRTVNEARRIVRHTPTSEIVRVSGKFAAHAREHYTPRQIFTGILGAL